MESKKQFNYVEEKKRKGLIFTAHNVNPEYPYITMNPYVPYPKPILTGEAPSFWSHLSGRYRTYEEQQEYIASGLVDKKLPAIKEG